MLILIMIKSINLKLLVSVLLLSFIQVSYCKDFTTTGDKSPIVNNTKGNVIINYNKSSSNTGSAEKLVIKGKWSKDAASKEVYRLLRQYERKNKNNFGYSPPDNNPYWKHFIHKIYGFYHLTSRDEKTVVAIAYTIPSPSTENECHGCGVSLSFIEFKNEARNWKLGKVHINMVHMGTWGEPPSLKAITIGYNNFGILSESGFTQGGYLERGISLYALVGSEYKIVFSEAIELDDSATGNPSRNSWKAKIHFNKVGTSYYDISVIRKGIKDAKVFEEKQIYMFDGQKYSTNDFIN